MTKLRESIGNERRRLRSVRQKLTAAAQMKASGDESFVPFYIAVTDYLETAMGRLHAQDIKMGDMIRDKSEQIDETVEKALGELDERLSGNQGHLKQLLDAGAKLRSEGKAGLEHFETVAKAYSDYITANMGHHGATTDLARDLFNQDDWEFMAGITDEETHRESELYDLVTRATPQNVTVPDD